MVIAVAVCGGVGRNTSEKQLTSPLYSHRPDLFGKKRFYTKFGEKQPFLCPEKPTF
jgi:hypothetical protein